MAGYYSGYSTGLCNCCSDCGVCLYTMCFPTCAMSYNWAESRNEDCTVCHYCAYSCPIWTRANIRVELGQVEKRYVQDCCVYCWCTQCAICQDARQLKIMRRAQLQSKTSSSGIQLNVYNGAPPTSSPMQNHPPINPQPTPMYATNPYYPYSYTQNPPPNDQYEIALISQD